MTKRCLPLIIIPFVLFSLSIGAQELKIKKGIIVDSLKVHDTIPETFALFLPRNFELRGKWPLMTVFDMKGNGGKEASKFVRIADRYGYVVAASNAVHDSLTLTENIVRTKRMMDHLLNILPINKSRVYAVGLQDGGRFANLVPVLIKDVEGALSMNASLANIELLNSKNPFQFIGIVDKTDYNYPILLKDEKLLNNLKFPNGILIGNSKDDDLNLRMDQAISYYELWAMAKGNIQRDSILIEELYQRDMRRIRKLLSNQQYLVANRAMAETITIFRTLRNTDSLRGQKKNLKRNRTFRVQKREEEAAFFKEALLREDFAYYLEEDVLTYNFNNLGWWNYQKSQIDKFTNGTSVAVQQMGQRLNGYINALIADNIDLVRSQKVVDEEALVFLYMLKTIVSPKDFANYLKVASIASKNEDFGTALYYLEEALKNGFRSKEQLYQIEHTALLRITPKFNALVKKYFDDARYKIIDE